MSFPFNKQSWSTCPSGRDLDDDYAFASANIVAFERQIVETDFWAVKVLRHGSVSVTAGAAAAAGKSSL